VTEPPNEMYDAICGLIEKLDKARLLLASVEDDLVAIRSRHSGLNIHSWHERSDTGSSTLEP
jgi:hypothetical protein